MWNVNWRRMEVKEGSRKDHVESVKRGSIDHSNRNFIPWDGNLTEKAAFLRGNRKLWWRNLKSCPCSAGDSKIQPVVSQGYRGICCRSRRGFHETGGDREQRILFNNLQIFGYDSGVITGIYLTFIVQKKKLYGLLPFPFSLTNNLITDSSLLQLSCF